MDNYQKLIIIILMFYILEIILFFTTGFHTIKYNIFSKFK